MVSANQRRRRQLQRNNNRSQGGPRVAITRAVNPARMHVQAWFAFKDKPQIKENQSVDHWTKTISPEQVPGLADFMSRYDMVTVNSLGARFKSGLVNTSGMSAIVVQTHERHALASKPNPPNHAWARNQGSGVKALSNPNSAAPSTNPPALKRPIQAGPKVGIGHVWFVYEGPGHDSLLSNVGEVEVYVDAIFEGLT